MDPVPIYHPFPPFTYNFLLTFPGFLLCCFPYRLVVPYFLSHQSEFLDVTISCKWIQKLSYISPVSSFFHIVFHSTFRGSSHSHVFNTASHLPARRQRRGKGGGGGRSGGDEQTSTGTQSASWREHPPGPPVHPSSRSAPPGRLRFIKPEPSLNKEQRTITRLQAGTQGLSRPVIAQKRPAKVVALHQV